LDEKGGFTKRVTLKKGQIWIFRRKEFQKQRKYMQSSKAWWVCSRKGKEASMTKK
jgi:hypothetical protein